MFTYYNNNIYNRNSTYSSDIICKYINGKCYKGNSTYISDVLWTYHNNRIYKGNSTYISDCILTVANNHVYQGNSTYSSDIIMTYEGYIPMSVLIICAMNLPQQTQINSLNACLYDNDCIVPSNCFCHKQAFLFLFYSFLY